MDIFKYRIKVRAHDDEPNLSVVELIELDTDEVVCSEVTHNQQYGGLSEAIKNIDTRYEASPAYVVEAIYNLMLTPEFNALVDKVKDLSKEEVIQKITQLYK